MPRTESKMKKEKNLRAKILDAALRVLSKNGYRKITVEAIAEEAGMSKGGVFYYFSSKDEILLGTLDRYNELFSEQREEVLKSLPKSRGGMLLASFIVMLRGANETEQAIPNLVSMLDFPEFRDKLAEMKRMFFKDLSKGLPVAYRCRLAEAFLLMDGLWMDKMFSPNPVYGSFARQVERDLIKIIESLEKEYARATKQKPMIKKAAAPK